MHKILIVDDERHARDLIAELIASYIPNSEVSKAESAYKALELMETKNFDLLFVDISMPGMTGLELLEKIHETGKQPYAFIITAHRRYDYAIRGIRLGILDYIEKPLHKEKISNAAKIYLSKIKSEMLELKVHTGVRRIPIESVVALEAVDRNKVKVYTADSLLPDVTDSLSELHKRLPANFCYIRRDCIVNLHEVKRYNPKTREIFISFQNKDCLFVASRNNAKELLTNLPPPIVKIC